MSLETTNSQSLSTKFTNNIAQLKLKSSIESKKAFSKLKETLKVSLTSVSEDTKSKETSTKFNLSSPIHSNTSSDDENYIRGGQRNKYLLKLPWIVPQKKIKNQNLPHQLNRDGNKNYVNIDEKKRSIPDKYSLYFQERVPKSESTIISSASTSSSSLNISLQKSLSEQPAVSDWMNNILTEFDNQTSSETENYIADNRMYDNLVPKLPPRNKNKNENLRIGSQETKARKNSIIQPWSSLEIPLMNPLAITDSTKSLEECQFLSRKLSTASEIKRYSFLQLLDDSFCAFEDDEDKIRNSKNEQKILRPNRCQKLIPSINFESDIVFNTGDFLNISGNNKAATPQLVEISNDIGKSNQKDVNEDNLANLKGGNLILSSSSSSEPASEPREVTEKTVEHKYKSKNMLIDNRKSISLEDILENFTKDKSKNMNDESNPSEWIEGLFSDCCSSSPDDIFDISTQSANEIFLGVNNAASDDDQSSNYQQMSENDSTSLMSLKNGSSTNMNVDFLPLEPSKIIIENFCDDDCEVNIKDQDGAKCILESSQKPSGKSDSTTRRQQHELAKMIIEQDSEKNFISTQDLTIDDLLTPSSPTFQKPENYSPELNADEISKHIESLSPKDISDENARFYSMIAFAKSDAKIRDFKNAIKSIKFVLSNIESLPTSDKQAIGNKIMNLLDFCAKRSSECAVYLGKLHATGIPGVLDADVTKSLQMLLTGDRKNHSDSIYNAALILEDLGSKKEVVHYLTRAAKLYLLY